MQVLELFSCRLSLTGNASMHYHYPPPPPPLVLCHLDALLDLEFGKLQARDMLQHLWTGPISNASVDVVQGSRSVEVRAVGVTKVTGIMVSRNV